MNCNLKSAIYICKKVNSNTTYPHTEEIKRIFLSGDKGRVFELCNTFVFNFYIKKCQRINFAKVKNDSFGNWKVFVSVNITNIELEIFHTKTSRSKTENLNDVSFNLFALAFW